MDSLSSEEGSQPTTFRVETRKDVFLLWCPWERKGHHRGPSAVHGRAATWEAGEGEQMFPRYKGCRVRGEEGGSINIYRTKLCLLTGDRARCGFPPRPGGGWESWSDKPEGNAAQPRWDPETQECLIFRK